MDFDHILDRAIEMLQRRGRLTYRTIKRQFGLDDEALEDLKAELLYSQPQVLDDEGRGLVWTDNPLTREDNGRRRELEGQFQATWRAVTLMLQNERRVTHRTLKYIFSLNDALLAEICKELRLRRLAVDEEGEVLVWTGETPPIVQPADSLQHLATISPVSPAPPSHVLAMNALEDVPVKPQISEPEPMRSTPEAERRQLTVMFCDLVGSTDLSGRLDPEDLREVVRAYQETAAQVVERYEGHIAQYLGDGLLIYFGYPVAHEDDAQRAVHSGLGIIKAMGGLKTRLETDYSVELAVRIGIHTGPVVVGEMGSGERLENLALGETPNIAARLEGLAASNTIVISPVTARLVQRSFNLENLGLHDLKGVSEPMMIARVDSETAGPDRQGSNMLVGRDEEIGLLLRRWTQAKEGLGQVVLLSGEAGIGKSSLVDRMRNQVRQEGLTRIIIQCSPYHTNSALYPIIESMKRTLGWHPDDTAEMKLTKLEQALEVTDLESQESVPLMSSLLSLELPADRYPDLTLSSQQQRQQTQDTLVAWLQDEAERQPMLAVWEDLHWADPSTLEVLELILEQTPTLPMLHLLTFRPEFEPPWAMRSHLTPITLNRLERLQVEALIDNMVRRKELPSEVVEHIVSKTDGVPLYVEELTKMLLESELLREESDQYVLTGPMVTMAIPDTLQDSLMARLDQMNTAKEVAQIGAVLGREFSYEMLQTVADQDEETVHTGLSQLVEAEILHQRGRLPRSRYIFKHALIQDAAYASLLRSTCQNIHQQIAIAIEEQFSEIADDQPERVAYHYAEAGLRERAIDWWKRAGERDYDRLACQEAITHLTKGIELLNATPDQPKHAQTELQLHMTLSQALAIAKGFGESQLESVYHRAQQLCQQLGDISNLVTVKRGLAQYYSARGQIALAQELNTQLLSQAEQQHDLARHVESYAAFSVTSSFIGNFEAVRDYAEHKLPPNCFQAVKLTLTTSAIDPSIMALSYLGISLWCLGYPYQALEKIREALARAQTASGIFSHVYVMYYEVLIRLFRREASLVQKRGGNLVALSHEHDFAQWALNGSILHGWTLAVQGHAERGIEQMREGLTTQKKMGMVSVRPWFLILLAEAYGINEQVENGLQVLTEARNLINHSGARFCEAELNRMHGELLLIASKDHHEAAESYFWQALDIARNQRAKSWELRTTISLAKLWQQQSKCQEAYDLLAPVYEWFTEGFDTADLKDAKLLLDELA